MQDAEIKTNAILFVVGSLKLKKKAVMVDDKCSKEIGDNEKS